MNSRPRVALVLHEMTLTGAPRLALSIFGALGTGVCLRIASRDAGPLEPEFRRLGEVAILSSVTRARDRRSGVIGRAARRLEDELRVLRVSRSLRSWRPDIVYANSVQALPALKRLRIGGFPVILHVHEAEVALEGFEAEHPGLIRNAPVRWIAVSQAVADQLVGRYGVPIDQLTVIPPFVEQPTGALGRSSGQRKPSDVVVGGMGNPTWTKGIDLWLLTAREVADRLGDGRARFVWLGVRDNESGRQMRAMVRKLGLEGTVEIRPESASAATELGSMDVLAITSWEESASLAALEAMSRAVPVVCFAGSGGPPEIVGDTGVVVPSFSPAAMADAIVDLLSDRPRRDALGVAARARVASAFNQDAAIEAIWAVIASVTPAG